MSPRTAHPWSPRAGYDRAATRYDSWHWQQFWRANERPLVERWLDRGEPVARAADLGAGTGAYLQTLAARARSVHGVDLSARMLHVARRRRHGASLIQASITHLPFATDSIDLAISTRVLTHVADVSEAFQEVARVLRSGARFLVTDIDPTHPYACTHLPGPRHEQVPIATYKHDVDELVDCAERAGLGTEDVRRLDVENLAWLPSGGFESIDRAGRNHVFFSVELRAR